MRSILCKKPGGQALLSLGEGLFYQQVYALKDEVEDKAVVYPEYYLQPFHAYPKGNLEWLPAFEVESATMSMAVRTFPGTEPVAAQRRLRDNIHTAIRVHPRHQFLVSPKNEQCSLARHLRSDTFT